MLAAADEDLAQGDGSFEVEVGLHVFVHDLRGRGELLDYVPPQGLATKRRHELALALHPVEVPTRCSPVAGVEESLAPAEPLHALAHVPFLGEDSVPDIDPDAVHGIDDLPEALEIYCGVVIDGDARVILQGVDRLVDAAVVVGSVDPVLPPRFDFDVEVARDGEQLHVSRFRHDLNKHDGVRAAPHLRVVWPRIDAEHEHVERSFRKRALPPEHPLDPTARRGLAPPGIGPVAERLYRELASDQHDADYQGDQHDRQRPQPPAAHPWTFLGVNLEIPHPR